jgi:hypothetical protein
MVMKACDWPLLDQSGDLCMVFFMHSFVHESSLFSTDSPQPSQRSVCKMLSCVCLDMIGARRYQNLLFPRVFGPSNIEFFTRFRGSFVAFWCILAKKSLRRLHTLDVVIMLWGPVFPSSPSWAWNIREKLSALFSLKCLIFIYTQEKRILLYEDEIFLSAIYTPLERAHLNWLVYVASHHVLHTCTPI